MYIYIYVFINMCTYSTYSVEKGTVLYQTSLPLSGSIHKKQHIAHAHNHTQPHTHNLLPETTNYVCSRHHSPAVSPR